VGDERAVPAWEANDMTDVTTNQPLRVEDEGGAGPYLMLPAMQLGVLTRLLECHRVSFWVDENLVSLDGEPETAFVEFGRRGDTATLRKILDSAP